MTGSEPAVHQPGRLIDRFLARVTDAEGRPLTEGQGNLLLRAWALTRPQERSTLLLAHGLPLAGLLIGWNPLAVLTLVCLEIVLHQLIALLRWLFAPPYATTGLLTRWLLSPILALFWCGLPFIQLQVAAAAYLGGSATDSALAVDLVLGLATVPQALVAAGLLLPAAALLAVLVYEGIGLAAEDAARGRRPDFGEPTLRIMLPMVVGLLLNLVMIPLAVVLVIGSAVFGWPSSLDSGGSAAGLSAGLWAIAVGVTVINKFFVEWALILWRRHRSGDGARQ